LFLVAALAAVALSALSYISWYAVLTSALTAGSQVIETERGRVEYALIGADDAPVVLSLHGVTGGYDFGLVVPDDMLGLPEAGFRVLSVSRPGYLRTPLADNLTPDAQADLYAALLDELGIESVALLGVSGGGPSALAFAHRHQDRVSAVVLAVAIADRWEPGAQSQSVTTFLNTPPALVDLLLWFSDEFQFRYQLPAFTRQTIIDNTLIEDPALNQLVDQVVADAERVENLRLSARASMPMSLRWEGTVNDLAQLMALPDAPDYSMISAPVLAFYGAQDKVVPLVHGEYLAESLPNLELHVDPSGGHAPFLHDGWANTRQRIIEFLNTHTA
jgi:pimeloyl-ACP methyl ester carboxylesterase